MFRLSKTTDYGIVLMAQLASDPSAVPHNARELAQCSDLPVPMVSKILKALAKEGLLVSQRGSKGGYSLAAPPEELSVSEMIRVLEGPVALTDCAIGPAHCEHETLCAVREPWQMISRIVERALAEVTLADLVFARGRSAAGLSAMSEMLQITVHQEGNTAGGVAGGASAKPEGGGSAGVTGAGGAHTQLTSTSTPTPTPTPISTSTSTSTGRTADTDRS